MKRLITFSLLAVFAVLTSCSQTNTDQVKINLDAQGPQIEFKKIEHDYGTIPQDADGNCEFVFVNTGSEPLILTNVRSSCGCTVPSWPKEAIAPGASGSIAVKYDTRRVGPISKTITVTSNASETPVILKIKGVVEAPAEANPAAPTVTN